MGSASSTAVPDRLRGLTGAEVAARVEQGLTNRVPAPARPPRGRGTWHHVLTPFNALVVALVATLLIVGPRPAALVGLVPVAASALDIVTARRARRARDRVARLDTTRVAVIRDGDQQLVHPDEVVEGDVVELEPGGPVVADGEVLAAEALEVDEGLLTGASLPRAAGRGTEVRAGGFVTTGRGWYRADRVGPGAHAAQLAAGARGSPTARPSVRRDVDRAVALTVLAIVPVTALLAGARWWDGGPGAGGARAVAAGVAAMAPAGLVLLAAVALAAGARRLARAGVLVRDLSDVDGLARVDVLCIDKTGTLTEPVLDVVGVDPLVPATPQGHGRGSSPGEGDGSGAGPAPAPDGHLLRQVLGAVAWSDPQPNATMSALAVAFPAPGWAPAWRVAFSATRRFAGAGFAGRGDWVLGAPDVLLAGGRSDPELAERATALVDPATRRGDRVLLLARVAGPPPDGAPAAALPRCTPVAVVTLHERTRAGAGDTLRLLQDRGIDVKVVSGDDPRTVGAVAGRLDLPAGEPVDGRDLPAGPERAADLADLAGPRAVFGRMTPDDKRDLVTALRSRGRSVAVLGDGVNDVPALAAADVGVALGSGSPASRAAAPVVLLDSALARLPAVLREGRRAVAAGERLAGLALAQTVCAALLALVVSVAGAPMPLLPGHVAAVATLGVAVPGLALALGLGGGDDRRPAPDLPGRALRFAAPTGAVAATATCAAYTLAGDVAGTDRTEARTVAATTLLLVALWCLVALARPGRRGPAALVAGVVVAFAATLAVPALRELSDLELGSPLAGLSAVGIAAMAGVALELGWQVSGWTGPLPAGRTGSPGDRSGGRTGPPAEAAGPGSGPVESQEQPGQPAGQAK